MNKYLGITHYLNAQNTERVRLSFAELESVLGFALPQSARKYPAWWSNDPTSGCHSGSWLAASWTTEDIDLAGEKVSFCRAGVSRLPHAEKPVRQNLPLSESPIQREPTESDAFDMRLALKWLMTGCLKCGENGDLVFPATKSIPGLYRFTLVSASGQKSYIGETVNLKRRFAHYRKPGPTQATNIRLNSILLAHLATGDVINIDVATEGILLEIGGKQCATDLEKKVVRRLFENAALLHGDELSIDSLNR